jgi:hypothetical protein
MIKNRTIIKTLACLMFLAITTGSKPKAMTVNVGFAYELKQLSISYTVYPYISNFPKQYPVQYSNDTDGLIRIKFEKIEFPYEVRVFDRAGKELSNAMFTFQKEVDLPLQQFERGSYIIAVYTSSKRLYDYSMLLIK